MASKYCPWRRWVRWESSARPSWNMRCFARQSIAHAGRAPHARTPPRSTPLEQHSCGSALRDSARGREGTLLRELRCSPAEPSWQPRVPVRGATPGQASYEVRQALRPGAVPALGGPPPQLQGARADRGRGPSSQPAQTRGTNVGGREGFVCCAWAACAPATGSTAAGWPSARAGGRRVRGPRGVQVFWDAFLQPPPWERLPLAPFSRRSNRPYAPAAMGPSSSCW
jgi:hypothetical protein